MKTKILKLSLLTAILGIALWSCKKDEFINPKTSKTVETSQLNNSTQLFNSIINQMDLIRPESFEIEAQNTYNSLTNPMENFLNYKDANNYLSEASFEIYNSESGVLTLNVFTQSTNIENITETYINTINQNEEYIITKITLEELSSGEYKIISLDAVETNMNLEAEAWYSGISSWTRSYAKCISGVLDTDHMLGGYITVLGVAGGVGCVPCGAAAGVLLGFGALGCLG